MGDAPSRSQLIKIGKALAAGTETPEQLDVLDTLLARCDEVQARARDELAAALPAFGSPADIPLEVRGRTKTLTTLREKLQRMGGQTLPVVRDLAGLRIVGDLSLDEQDQLLEYACAVLQVELAEVNVIDRRAEPMRGYRALHAEFLLDGVRVELQIRTMRQHLWAEINERLGDVLGRGIRYPDEEHERLLEVSNEDIADPEKVSFDQVLLLWMDAVSQGIANLELLDMEQRRMRAEMLAADEIDEEVADQFARAGNYRIELDREVQEDLTRVARTIEQQATRGEQP